MRCLTAAIIPLHPQGTGGVPPETLRSPCGNGASNPGDEAFAGAEGIADGNKDFGFQG